LSPNTNYIVFFLLILTAPGQRRLPTSLMSSLSSLSSLSLHYCVLAENDEGHTANNNEHGQATAHLLPEDEWEGDDDDETHAAGHWFEGAYNGEGAGPVMGAGEELDVDDDASEEIDSEDEEDSEDSEDEDGGEVGQTGGEKVVAVESDGNTGQTQQPTQKQQQQGQKQKKKKRRPPRVWESNAIATMEVINIDKHPNWIKEHLDELDDYQKNHIGIGDTETNGGSTAEDSKTSEQAHHFGVGNGIIGATFKKLLRDTSHLSQPAHPVQNTETFDDDEEKEEEEDEDEEEIGTYLPLPNLSKLTPEEAATTILSTTHGISMNLQQRLAKMFQKAKSHSCRAKIAEHFALFVNGLAEETKFPFEDFYYPNTCTAIPRYGDWENLPEGVTVNQIQYREYQPDKDEVPEGTYIDNVEDLKICYVILTHDAPEATIRLITSLYVEKVTNFVIHVDGKEKSGATYDRLVEYAKEMNEYAISAEGGEEYIRIVPRKKSVRVNWGGFTMVKATLVALNTAFGLDHYNDLRKQTKNVTKLAEEEGTDAKGRPLHDNPHAFKFHKLIHLASTTYPLASNTEIRNTIASHPLDANFLHIILRPQNPTPSVWNYFVECDDAVHRIYRLPILNYERGNGVDIYTSSQWFIISRDFAWYLADPPKESFVDYYLEYIEHVVVADESFFGTVLRNTHFCATLHNDNFLHLQFDRWENEAAGQRDERKCIMKNPDHCGRSPTTMTLDYLPTLELSGDLFARKFDDAVEPLIKDYIDKRREKEEERLKREKEFMKDMEAENKTESLPLEEWEFQGEGVLIVAKETVGDKEPLCLGMEKDNNKVLLRPCFRKEVPPTLSPNWETGAVIIEETISYNRWDIGPCSSDGDLKRNETGELEMIPGEYSVTGPKCMLKIGDGARAGRCLDVDSERNQPGGLMHIYPCVTKWHQLFSFGNGTIAPRGAIHASLPLHIVRQLENKKKNVTAQLCLGVKGRGDADESSWDEDKGKNEEEEKEDNQDAEVGPHPWEQPDADLYPNGRKSLQLWSGQQIQTTPCSNSGAVIEWYYVPFIIEDYGDEEGMISDADASSSEKSSGNSATMSETDEEL